MIIVTPAPTPTAGSTLSCDLVDVEDVQVILNREQVTGPEMYSMANGLSAECRWYSREGDRVLSIVFFFDRDDAPDWGRGQEGLTAHNEFVGLDWHDFVSSLGDCYWYRGARSGTWGQADVVVMSPQDDCRADRIGDYVTDIVADLAAGR